MKKKLIMAASTLAATGVIGSASLGLAHADSQSNTQTLVDKIAQKFSLNKDEVQQVFDANKQEHVAEHKAKMADRLAQAVTDGTITQEQADQLKAKFEEMKTFRESMKDKTVDERRSAMKEKMDELKQWMEDNNIPQEFRMMGGKGRGPHGPPAEDQQ